MAQVKNPQTGLMEEVPDDGAFGAVGLDNTDAGILPASSVPDVSSTPSPAPAPITEPAGVVQSPGTQPPSQPKPSAPVLNLGETESETKTSSKSYAPGTLEAIKQAGTEAQTALTGLTGAEVEVERAKQDAALKIANYQQQQVDLQQEHEQARRKVLDEETSKLDQIRKEYEESSVDPQNYWKNTSMGGKVVALASIALSGLGNAYSAAASPGSNAPQNAAMKIINESIERDIDAQKANIAKKGKAVDSRSQELVNLRNRLGDERAAELALAAQRYDAFGKTVLAEAQKSNIPAIQQRGELAKAQLDEKAAEKMAELTAHVEQTSNKKATKDVIGKAAEKTASTDTQRTKYTDSQLAAVNTQKLINDIKSSKSPGFGPIEGRLKGFVSGLGFKVPGDFYELNQRNQELFLQNAKRALTGVLSQQDIELLAKQNPQAFTNPSDMLKGLEHIRDTSLQTAKAMEDNAGGRLDLGERLPEYEQLFNTNTRKNMQKGR